MASQSEGWFTLKDGTKLYTKIWEPASTPVAHLIALHGFSDHINAYYNLFPTLASQHNVKVHGFDQRGWGRSAPQKSEWGRTGATAEVIDDIEQFVQHVTSTLPASAPLFLFGHSMGGNEALTYLLDLGHGPDQHHHTSTPSASLSRFQGLILEAPYITLPPSAQPSAFLVFAGRLAAKILPNQQMKQPLDPAAMSRDPKVCQDWKNDPLCHDTGTLLGLAGLLDRAATLDDIGKDSGRVKGSSELVKLPCPAFWAHGDGDRVCSYAASQRLYEALLNDAGGRYPATEFKDYKGAYHKLHAEPDGVGEQFANDVGAWIGKVVAGSGAATAASAGAAPHGGDEVTKSKL